MHIIFIFVMFEANRKMDTGKKPYGNNTHRHPELPSQSFWNPQFQLGRASEGPLIAPIATFSSTSIYMYL
jgi:hypothetical protein